jgi:chaperone modulatory protein CbpM
MSFSDIDLARAQLIHELMNDLGVNAEGVGIVLRLVDQVHGLRSVLAETVAALRAR